MPKPSNEMFERRIRELLPRINAMAFRFAYPDSDLAKDLVQDCVVKAYAQYNAGKLDLGEPFSGWMSTVIRNEYLMHLRKNKRMVPSTDETEKKEIPVDSTSAYDSASIRHLLHAAIAELPPEQAEVVRLIDIRQFDYDEAAEFLQIPVGTVRSRLSRARLKLAGKLSFLEDQS